MALGAGTKDPARGVRPARIGRRGKMLWKVGAFAVGCLASAPHKANAEPAPTSTGATVDTPAGNDAADLFRRGRDAMKAGNYGAACSLFEASQRVDPAPGTLLNVAVCSERLGRLRRAGSALKAFLEAADPADERRTRASVLLADVIERTPRVSIRVPAWAAAEAQVMVDGDAIAPDAWKAAVQLDPGRHVLEVRVPGATDQRRTLEVKEHDRLVETFVFGTPPEVKRDDRRALPPALDPLPPAFYVSLGVGVAGLITAAGSHAIVLRQLATVEDHCENKKCDAEGIAARDQGRRFEIVRGVALPVGIAGLGLAGYLLFTRKKHPNPTIGVSLAPTQAVVSAYGRY